MCVNLESASALLLSMGERGESEEQKGVSSPVLRRDPRRSPWKADVKLCVPVCGTVLADHFFFCSGIYFHVQRRW